MKRILILSFLILVILVAGCVNPDKDPRKYEIVNCINSHGGMLYYFSSTYSTQMFGYAWKNLSKFDCDKNKYVCNELGIKSTSWRVNNTIIKGDKTLKELNELYKCGIDFSN